MPPRFGRRSVKRTYAIRRKTRTRKARTFKRFGGRPRRRIVPRPIWARSRVVRKFTYAHYLQLQPGSGFANRAIAVYRANAPYAPLALPGPAPPFGDGQPRYWDLVTPGFKYYTCLGSKMRATLLPSVSPAPGAGTAPPAAFFIQLTHNSGPTAYDDLADAATNGNRLHSAGNLLGPKRSYRKGWSLRKERGRGAKHDPLFQAYTNPTPAGTDGLPAEVRYFQIVASSLGSSVPEAMFFVVKIDYIVMFDTVRDDVGDS